RRARAPRDAAMADVPDGRSRADVRADAPLSPCREGARAVRDRTLYARDPAALRRARRSARQTRPPRRRILDRRHRDLSVGRAVRMAQGESRRLPERAALVRRAVEAPGRRARDGRAAGRAVIGAERNALGADTDCRAPRFHGPEFSWIMLRGFDRTRTRR